VPTRAVAGLTVALPPRRDGPRDRCRSRPAKRDRSATSPCRDGRVVIFCAVAWGHEPRSGAWRTDEPSVYGGGAVSRGPITAGLNPEQLRAVETVRGPVCILAGAGSGKTETITRRIANQVVSGAFAPTQILAVTFTRKAADELKARLRELGAPGVPARTFHAAAYAQLRYFAAETRAVIDSKAQLLLPLVRGLPKPYDDRAVSDIATEIEWAKNGRLDPVAYQGAASASGRVPPLPDELMARVYREYERRKEQARQIDHEDQLELTIRMFEGDESKLAEFRERYRAFTVDEYQDVNLLQQSLLELWLGERDELCVVGDDYQSIYSFTGATPAHLLGVPARYPDATVIRLEQNYRSTPEILALANRVAPRLGGARKLLRATKPAGPEPVLRPYETNEDEAAFIAARVGELRARGVPLCEIAVLYRAGFRSPLYEDALLGAGIPFQVREGAFLERPAGRSLVSRLERRAGQVASAVGVEEEARRAGLLRSPPRDVGPAELTRQRDLARFVSLAREFEDGSRRVSDFLAHLRERFDPESERDAVQLMTYHSAKGLEFEVVFLPKVEDRELPWWRQVEQGDVSEERRLFYVGLTRAKRELYVTWSRRRERSRFLDELLPAPGKSAPPRPAAGRTKPKVRPARGGSSTSSGGPRLAPGSWRPSWMREKD
jgi:DNA helicase II / ATP-dependent DNA helicase PcrA